MAAYRAVTAMKMMQKWNKSLAATVRVFVMTFKRSWNWKVFSRRSNARRYTKHEMSCTTARSTRNTGCECDVTKYALCGASYLEHAFQFGNFVHSQ